MQILVLGAGLMGVTTAWMLAEDGHDVTVVDAAAEPAAGTSHANAGLVAPSHAYAWAAPGAPRTLLASMLQPHPPVRLVPRLDPGQWRWCLDFLAECRSERFRANSLAKFRLCRYSQALLHEVAAATGIGFDRRDGGVLYLYGTPATLDRALGNAGLFRREGLELEPLDRAGVLAREPALERASFAGAIFCPSDESGDARAFTAGLAARLARRVDFRFSTRIARLEAESDRLVAAETEEGERLSADAFVLALGPQSPGLMRPLGVRLPIWPVKGYSATFPAGPGAPSLGGVEKDRFVAWARFGDRVRLTATAEIGGPGLHHRPADFAQMIAVGRSLFPDAADWERPAYWAGLRPMTPTGLPILGRGRHRNLWFNTGQGHMGWTMSCGSARITADLLAGRRPAVDLPLFGP